MWLAARFLDARRGFERKSARQKYKFHTRKCVYSVRIQPCLLQITFIYWREAWHIFISPWIYSQTGFELGGGDSVYTSSWSPVVGRILHVCCSVVNKLEGSRRPTAEDGDDDGEILV